MAKFIILLALVAATQAYGKVGVGVSQHVGVTTSKFKIAPYWGLGYGMLAHPAIIGPQIAIAGHKLAGLGGLAIKGGLVAKGVGAGVAGAGYGLTSLGLMKKGIGMYGLYPGGIGIGYGLLG